MERWQGRVAVVTGASGGIGAAVARGLVARGLRVAGLARRADKLQELGASLDGAPGQLHPVTCDLTQEDDILAAFQWIDANLGGVDVLVNNAGILHVAPLANGNPEHWREIMKVNVLALSICTREALKSMKKRKVDDGHIIHINRVIRRRGWLGDEVTATTVATPGEARELSLGRPGEVMPHGSCRVRSVAGHFPSRVPGVSMYAASKHAVTALTEGLRRELVGSGSKVKVTSVSPGVVHTDMVSQFGAVKGLQPEDVAASVIFSLSTPPHVQIHEVMLRGVPEVLPISGEQPADFPLEYQRSGPPPESTRDVPPVNPPERTNIPSVDPSESTRDVPPVNPPESTENIPSVDPSESTRDVPPVNPPENTENIPSVDPSESTRDVPPVNPPERTNIPSVDPPESTPETPAESPPEDQAEKQPEHPPGQPTSANQEPEIPPETAEVEQPGKPPESPPESPLEKISEAPLTGS